MQDQYAGIGEVRGMGLVQGVELAWDRKTRQPVAEDMRRLMDLAKSYDLILGKGVSRKCGPCLPCSEVHPEGRRRCHWPVGLLLEPAAAGTVQTFVPLDALKRHPPARRRQSAAVFCAPAFDPLEEALHADS